MKGPSLDAIRRFKEQQERKKREDEERRIEEKLSILKHRASQGDRKAKQDLKRFETVKKEAELKPKTVQNVAPKQKVPIHERPKRKPVVTDFDELMKLAKTNNNELRKDDPLPKLPPPSKSQKVLHSQKQMQLPKNPIPAPQPHPSTSSQRLLTRDQICNNRPPVARVPNDRPMPRAKPCLNSRVDMDLHRSRYVGSRPPRPQPIDYEYEDEYEDDDFVVDDDDDDAQTELRDTLKSVFRYDRRRCDLREQELDRQYRAIGNVNTFEDLEREERRASRLAAMEDAKALQEEEERKKLKRMRLKKL